VPQDQNIEKCIPPENWRPSDVWGAWVTDKPKGWHEILPAWEVFNGLSS